MQEKMKDKIVIDMGFANLVVSKSTDPNFPNEVYVYYADKKGVCIQDIVMVNQKYIQKTSGELNDEFVFEPSVEVRVYSDEFSEDYTHCFDVKLYPEYAEDLKKERRGIGVK